MTAPTLTTKPDKFAVRAVMQQHRDTRILPTPAEIRRQLGWGLITFVPRTHSERQS